MSAHDAGDAGEVCLPVDEAVELAELLRFFTDWLTGEDTAMLSQSLERMPLGGRPGRPAHGAGHALAVRRTPSSRRGDRVLTGRDDPDTPVPDLRRAGPEPVPPAPVVQPRPGLAGELLSELAPILAEDGIDVTDIDASDIDTLRAVMGSAVERRNMTMFTPVGRARDAAITTLRLAVEAITTSETRAAARVLGTVPSEAPPDGVTVAGVIGVALDLLDHARPAHDGTQASRSATRPGLPAGHWHGEQAAIDVLVLAESGEAFSGLGKLITRHGGQRVLYGAVLALAATIEAQARHADTPLFGLIADIIR